jgi:hypothetical protein
MTQTSITIFPKVTRKAKRAADLARCHEAFLQREREGKETYCLTVLDKFSIEKQMLEEVTVRLDAIVPFLIEGVEYTPQDLIWGQLFGALCAKKHPEIVLSLKHMASLPNARIKETQWGRFTLA